MKKGSSPCKDKWAQTAPGLFVELTLRTSLVHLQLVNLTVKLQVFDRLAVMNDFLQGLHTNADVPFHKLLSYAFIAFRSFNTTRNHRLIKYQQQKIGRASCRERV